MGSQGVSQNSLLLHPEHGTGAQGQPRPKSRRRNDPDSAKRRCISTACAACRKRKSKCDGALPSCAACASVYGTVCIYDPSSDHRRKGTSRGKGSKPAVQAVVSRKHTDHPKPREATLEVLMKAVLSVETDRLVDLVNEIRSASSLELAAQKLLDQRASAGGLTDHDSSETFDMNDGVDDLPRKMGALRLEHGSVRYIGGTSHLVHMGGDLQDLDMDDSVSESSVNSNTSTTWTRVTDDPGLVVHLVNMYFNYHYAYFTILSRRLFWRDFSRGRRGCKRGGPFYCSSLLVNAMLALGCHFSEIPGACAVPGKVSTKGDHFFAEAKRLINEHDLYDRPCLTTVQALALMSVREAGCGREAKGWVYSGVSFRMAQDMGLNLDVGEVERKRMTDDEIDARKITFWGCFLIDKCWSNYLGRLPQLAKDFFNVGYIDVLPEEEAVSWMPLTDAGFDTSRQQPGRSRGIATQLSRLSEVSSDLLVFFYHPSHKAKPNDKPMELEKLRQVHAALETWQEDLPVELKVREDAMPNVLLMHAFFHLQYIHLFRPFLRYGRLTPAMPGQSSPQQACVEHAATISQLLRQYKKIWGVKQICNIAVYMLHSACLMHLLNLHEGTAEEDLTADLYLLEEMTDFWPCSQRSLGILAVLAAQWKCQVSEEAIGILRKALQRFNARASATSSGTLSRAYAPSSKAQHRANENGDGTVQQPFFRPSEVVGSGTDGYGIALPQAPQQMAKLAASSTNGNSANPDMLPPRTMQPAGTAQDAYAAPAFGMEGLDMAYLPDGIEMSGSMIHPLPNLSTNSRDWLLSDGARLQQNFEGWDLDQGDESGGQQYVDVLMPGNQDEWQTQLG